MQSLACMTQYVLTEIIHDVLDVPACVHIFLYLHGCVHFFFPSETLSSICLSALLIHLCIFQP